MQTDRETSSHPSFEIYDPSRSIRSVDVFVAAANTTGITAHFVGVVASLSVFNWLHRPTD